MNLFDVYPLNNVNPVKALGSKIWDEKGQEYLDFYGGHAVISIGHSHPHYVKTLGEQLQKIGFYSNSVKIPLQNELAEKLGKISKFEDYQLFLVNSGAEANENALKLASFHNGRKKTIAFNSSFHGRTSAAVAVTDNTKIKAPINFDEHVVFLPFNNIDALKAIDHETCAVIVEGIQGVSGIRVADELFLKGIRKKCDETGAVFIHDSVQCGYGRTGNFFSFQDSDLKPDIISIAKGMGNGFPIGAILISPKFQSSYGLLGTTFGGNHLACAAAIAVIDVINDENLINNAKEKGDYLLKELRAFKNIKEVRGKGLMIGIELETEVNAIRNELLYENHIFTGSSGSNIIRLLPSLAINQAETERFLSVFEKILTKNN